MTAGWRVAMAAFLGLAAAMASLPATALPAKLDPAQAPVQLAAFVQHWSNLHKPGEEGALGEYQLAQMADPGNVAVLEKMSLYLNKSDAFYGDILAFLPDNINANHYLGQNLMKDGFAALALPHFLRAQVQVPLNDGVAEWTGLAAFLSGDYATCERMYGEAVRLLPDFVRRVRHGDCLAMLGRRDEAKAEFEAAKTMDATRAWYFPIRMMEDGVYDGCKGTAADHVKKARAAIADSHPYEMYREARWARLCDPDDLDALQVLAEVEAKTDRSNGDYAFDAKVHARQLANLKDGGQTDAKRARSSASPTVADMLDEGEKLDLSKTTAPRVVAGYLASRVLLADPANARARLLRARAFNNLKIDALAPQAWVDTGYALNDPATIPRARFVRGILLMTYGDPGGAVTELTQAIVADPSDLRFLHTRAMANMQAGDNPAASKDIDAALTRDPKSIEYRLARAEIRRRLKDYAGARDDTLIVMETVPNNHEARSLEIRILDESGEREVADLRHWAWLRDNEKVARADSYLSQRNPAVVASYDREKAEDAEAASKDHVVRYLTALYDDYDAADAEFNAAFEDEDADRMRAARQDIHDMITRGERFYDDPDAAYMSDAQRDALAHNLNVAREAYDDMKQPLEDMESSTGNYGDEDDADWSY